MRAPENNHTLKISSQVLPRRSLREGSRRGSIPRQLTVRDSMLSFLDDNTSVDIFKKHAKKANTNTDNKTKKKKKIDTKPNPHLGTEVVSTAKKKSKKEKDKLTSPSSEEKIEEEKLREEPIGEELAEKSFKFAEKQRLSSEETSPEEPIENELAGKSFELEGSAFKLKKKEKKLQSPPPPEEEEDVSAVQEKLDAENRNNEDEVVSLGDAVLFANEVTKEKPASLPEIDEVEEEKLALVADDAGTIEEGSINDDELLSLGNNALEEKSALDASVQEWRQLQEWRHASMQKSIKELESTAVYEPFSRMSLTVEVASPVLGDDSDPSCDFANTGHHCDADAPAAADAGRHQVPTRMLQEETIPDAHSEECCSTDYETLSQSSCSVSQQSEPIDPTSLRTSPRNSAKKHAKRAKTNTDDKTNKTNKLKKKKKTDTKKKETPPNSHLRTEVVSAPKKKSKKEKGKRSSEESSEEEKLREEPIGEELAEKSFKFGEKQRLSSEETSPEEPIENELAGKSFELEGSAFKLEEKKKKLQSPPPPEEEEVSAFQERLNAENRNNEDEEVSLGDAVLFANVVTKEKPASLPEIDEVEEEKLVPVADDAGTIEEGSINDDELLSLGNNALEEKSPLNASLQELRHASMQKSIKELESTAVYEPFSRMSLTVEGASPVSGDDSDTSCDFANTGHHCDAAAAAAAGHHQVPTRMLQEETIPEAHSEECCSTDYQTLSPKSPPSSSSSQFGEAPKGYSSGVRRGAGFMGMSGGVKGGGDKDEGPTGGSNHGGDSNFPAPKVDSNNSNPYDDDDEEVDAVWADFDERMNAKRHKNSRREGPEQYVGATSQPVDDARAHTRRLKALAPINPAHKTTTNSKPTWLGLVKGSILKATRLSVESRHMVNPLVRETIQKSEDNKFRVNVPILKKKTDVLSKPSIKKYGCSSPESKKSHLKMVAQNESGPGSTLLQGKIQMTQSHTEMVPNPSEKQTQGFATVRTRGLPPIRDLTPTRGLSPAQGRSPARGVTRGISPALANYRSTKTESQQNGLSPTRGGPPTRSLSLTRGLPRGSIPTESQQNVGTEELQSKSKRGEPSKSEIRTISTQTSRNMDDSDNLAPQQSYESLRKRDSPNLSSVETSQSVLLGEMDVEEPVEEPDEEPVGNWRPIETDLLPIRHYLAQNIADNPSAIEEGGESDSEDSLTKDSLSKSVTYHDGSITTMSDMDTWCIPHSDENDSSWVNPTRETGSSRKKQIYAKLKESPPDLQEVSKHEHPVSTSSQYGSIAAESKEAPSDEESEGCESSQTKSERQEKVISICSELDSIAGESKQGTSATQGMSRAEGIPRDLSVPPTHDGRIPAERNENVEQIPRGYDLKIDELGNHPPLYNFENNSKRGRNTANSVISEVAFDKLASKRVYETSMPKESPTLDTSWSVPSSSTTVDRVFRKLDDTGSRDYRLSYIASTHSRSAASYSDSVRERYFPNQEDNPFWAPSARQTDLDTLLSTKSRDRSESFEDEESWRPPKKITPEPARNYQSRVKRIDFTGAVTQEDLDWVPAPSIAATSSVAEEKYSETSSEFDDVSDVSAKEYMESSEIVVVDRDEWFIQSEPAAEHPQFMPTNKTQEGTSRLQVPLGLEKSPCIRDEPDAEHPQFMPTNDTQEDTSRLQVPLGLEKAPSIRDDGESRIDPAADEKRHIIHSTSGRLQFDMTPETIDIDSDIEKATTKKKRNKDHGMPKKVYGTTLGYLMLCIFVVLIPAGVTIYFLILFNKDDNGGGADPNDLGMNSTSATLEPSTSPSGPPSFLRPPFGGD